MAEVGAVSFLPLIRPMFIVAMYKDGGVDNHKYLLNRAEAGPKAGIALQHDSRSEAECLRSI